MDQRLTTIFAAGVAALALAVPALAPAADVAPQVSRSAPARFPTAIPGCRPQCRQGAVIPRGRVLLSRKVRLEPGERRTRLGFTCPPGHRFMTFGALTAGSADVLPQIPDSQLPYTNRRRVTLVAERNLQPLSRASTGTVYAVCARR